MKKLILIFTLFLLATDASFGQYRSLFKESTLNFKLDSLDVFENSISSANIISPTFRLQKYQDMKFISMNRIDGVFDDIYLIDRDGNTHFHTIRPSVPLNTDITKRGIYDSSNPWQNPNQDIGNAIVGGLASIISMMVN